MKGVVEGSGERAVLERMWDGVWGWRGLAVVRLKRVGEVWGGGGGGGLCGAGWVWGRSVVGEGGRVG